MYESVDGGILEGGGQILRNAVALCCLRKKGIRIENIRKNRTKPGLRPQHLNGLQLVSRICSARLDGDEVGSSCVHFQPDKVKSGNFEADTKTAGSISLLMQISVPCICFGEDVSILTLRGGTDAEMAPPIDYYIQVFLPTAKKFGISAVCNLIRRGFYPQGKGEVVIEVEGVKQLKPVVMREFGQVKRIFGHAFVAGSLPNKITQKMAGSAIQYITQSTGIRPVITTFRETEQKAFATGCGIIIIAETSSGCLLGGSAVGKKGKSSEEVGLEAARMLCEDISYQACVDRWLQDQLIIFMALASGESEIKTGPLTLHTRTAIHLAEKLTEAVFTVENVNENENIIKCRGIGYQYHNV